MTSLCRNLIKIALNTPQRRLFSSVVYKSTISLENIYPNSSLKLSTPAKFPVDPNEKFTGFIPLDELDITYSRSSGPGGQNVNKVNTKVEVRFHLESAKWIHPEIKSKLSDKLENRITKEGFLIFRSDLTRSQQLNLADCLEKIRKTVRSCAVEAKTPSPETEERIRRRLERASVERLAIKRDRSQVKAQRQPPEVVL